MLDSLKASKISAITIIGKGHVTFDSLNLLAGNNIKLISVGELNMFWNLRTGKMYNFLLKSERILTKPKK